MMRHVIEWRIDREGDTARVTLSGSVTEHASFDILTTDLGSPTKIRFDLGDVERINSCGVREWLRFMGSLPAAAETRFENCSTPIVHQINLIQGFTGAGKVASIRVPFICDACESHESTTVPVEQGVVPTLPARACSKCQRAMEFDDFEESYFAFLLR